VKLGGRTFVSSIEQGAATPRFVATDPSRTTVSGEIFADCKRIAAERRHATDRVLALTKEFQA
jgi:hypothetical protein